MSNQSGDGWELRFDENAKGKHEQLDELVADSPKSVHLESMGDHWCLIVEAKDGTSINLTLHGTAKAAKGFVFELTRPKPKPKRTRRTYPGGRGCICEFDEGCGGSRVLHCRGCGGDLCICRCGVGELECDGCDDCDERAEGSAFEDYDHFDLRGGEA